MNSFLLFYLFCFIIINWYFYQFFKSTFLLKYFKFEFNNQQFIFYNCQYIELITFVNMLSKQSNNRKYSK